MQFASLGELLETKKTCPICSGPLEYSFRTVNDRAYVKFRRYDEDVHMTINLNNNHVTYAQFCGEGADVYRQENIFQAHCQKREVLLKEHQLGYSNYQYRMSFCVNLNSTRTAVDEIEILHEKFYFVEGSTGCELTLDYHHNESEIALFEQNKEKCIIAPMEYIKHDQLNQPYLMKKVRTILLMKDG